MEEKDNSRYEFEKDAVQRLARIESTLNEWHETMNRMDVLYRVSIESEQSVKSAHKRIDKLEIDAEHEHEEIKESFKDCIRDQTDHLYKMGALICSVIAFGATIIANFLLNWISMHLK